MIDIKGGPDPTLSIESSQKLSGDFFYRIIDKIFDDRCPALPTLEARPTDEWQLAASS